MSGAFELDHAKLAADPRFAGLARELERLGPIDSRDSFNRYCRNACSVWSRTFPASVGKTTELFGTLLAKIGSGRENVIPTKWGGVVVEYHEHPEVEKYLVIRRGGYLALETHAEKDERLEVTEGAGLILWRSNSDEPLTAEALEPGREFHFRPGMVHCIIGTENVLLFERSTDPKGMDQDLIFIYEPD